MPVLFFYSFWHTYRTNGLVLGKSLKTVKQNETRLNINTDTFIRGFSCKTFLIPPQRYSLICVNNECSNFYDVDNDRRKCCPFRNAIGRGPHFVVLNVHIAAFLISWSTRRKLASLQLLKITFFALGSI